MNVCSTNLISYHLHAFTPDMGKRKISKEQFSIRVLRRHSCIRE